MKSITTLGESMRLIKMLGIAAMLALTAMAFVGATSASASIKELTMCKAHENLCKKANILREIHGTATNPVLLGNLNEKCTSSLVVLKETGLATTTTITGQVTTLTFTGCSPCTTVTTSPPYAASATKTAFTSAGSAVLGGCPFGINCKFGTKGTALEYGKNAEGLVTEAIAKEEVLTLEEGSAFFCGSSGKWDAVYKLTTPFLFVDEREVA
jgi:hypothetical protein